MSVALTLALIILLATVSAAGQQDTAAPLIFHMRHTDGQCAWSVTDVLSKKERTLHRTDTCPDSLILDLRNQKAHFHFDQTLYSAPIANLSDVMEIPKSPCSVHWLRIRPKSGQLRIATDCSESEIVSEKGKHYLKMGERKVRVLDKGPTLFWELNAEGQWVPLTLTEWNSLPSPREVLDFKELMYSATCAATKCETRQKIPRRANDRLNTTLKRSVESFAYLGFGGTSAMVYARDMGDTWHGVTPVFYCLDSCKAVVDLGLSDNWGHYGQLSVSVQGSFALIAGEYDGKQGLLYKSGDPNPYLKFEDSVFVTWLPAKSLWEAAK